MDVIRLYRDYSIEIAPDEHKHSRPGWVNAECPFCSHLPGANPGYHLGWNEQEEFFFCWRCGWSSPAKTISALLHITEYEAKNILNLYGVNKIVHTKEAKAKEPFCLPSGVIDGLSTAHCNYLNHRGFDAHKIEKQWRLQCTGPVGRLNIRNEYELDYRFRIIIPFFWNGEMVSFDSRDITGKQTAKYKACPEEFEKISRKEILYGNQEQWTETGICVEGPSDVWRLGEQSFAVSGIQYTQKQMKVMARTFRRVAVVFDDEMQAQQQAKKLVSELKFRGVDAWNIKIKGDPGGLRQRKANELIKTILK